MLKVKFENVICGRLIKVYLFSYWAIFMLFLSSADFFSKSTILKNSFRNTFRVSNSLDPDLARHLSGLIWVQPVCKDYADDTSR